MSVTQLFQYQRLAQPITAALSPLTVIVATGDDDAAWLVPDIGSPSWLLAASDALLGRSSDSSNHRWDRFTSVSVPQGVVIDSATLRLFKTNSGGGAAGKMRSQAEAADNPAMPTDATDAASRTLTPGREWLVETAPVQDYQDIDVTELVQTVTSRSGWVAGNALSIASKSIDTVTASVTYDFREKAGRHAQLTITWRNWDGVYMDRWWRPLEVSPHLTAPVRNNGRLHPATAGIFVTWLSPAHFDPKQLDWYQPLATPVLPLKPRPRGGWVGVTESSLLVTPALDSWFRPLERPVLPRPRCQEGRWTGVAEPTLFVGIDHWYRPLEQPPARNRWLVHPATAGWWTSVFADIIPPAQAAPLIEVRLVNRLVTEVLVTSEALYAVYLKDAEVTDSEPSMR